MAWYTLSVEPDLSGQEMLAVSILLPNIKLWDAGRNIESSSLVF